MNESCDWIISVVKSVNDPFQLECCHKLLQLFQDKYGSEGTKCAALIIDAIVEKETFISVDA